MCNGDLGMFRVMPWAYPTISGGSSGGTSVNPTPTPNPDPEEPTGPYDLTNYSVSFYYYNRESTKDNDGYIFFFGLSVSGAVEVDTSNVSQVKVTFGSGNMILSDGQTIDVTSLMDPVRKSLKFSIDNLDTGSFDQFAFYKKSLGLKGLKVTGFSEGTTMVVNVYDSAGNVLQTKEVVIT